MDDAAHAQMEYGVGLMMGGVAAGDADALRLHRRAVAVTAAMNGAYGELAVNVVERLHMQYAQEPRIAAIEVGDLFGLPAQGLLDAYTARCLAQDPGHDDPD